MKSVAVVAAELAPALEVYMEKEPDVSNMTMANALEELSSMYKRKQLLEDMKKKSKEG